MLPDDQNFDEPPVYYIDLSLPPSQRYIAVAQDLAPSLDGIDYLFNDVLRQVLPRKFIPWVRFLASMLLRRLAVPEEDEEIRGIAASLGIQLYLLVALNTFLDLMMGCTSGAARIRDRSKRTRLAHFRTLDWGMDPLRKLVVHLKYVRGPSQLVIAETITYVRALIYLFLLQSNNIMCSQFGYVGILTGCKPGLSVSLNFRAARRSSGMWENFRYRIHQILVLLGLRASLPSTLRSILLSNNSDLDTEEMNKITLKLSSIKSTAAYIILCNGQEVHVLEKDFQSAVVRSSQEFLVSTNHDEVDSANATRASQRNGHIDNTRHRSIAAMLEDASLQWLLEDSKERASCVKQKWLTCSSTKVESTSKASRTSLPLHVLRQWILQWPTANESTHFSCLMDPTEGGILHATRWLTPIEEP